MCGIAGWYRRGGRAVSPATIAAQCDRIYHRGPDDSGQVVDGDFGFGMRRLSIVDVGGGHQPIASADGRYAVVFNGEIYNHRELREELKPRGVRFMTNSDTETLLASFIQWGDDAWHRLEGMFAVAIWDRLTRRLTLARDPLGIKPLYLTQQRGGLAFGSEIRSLRLLPDHDFDLDDRAVHDFFSFGHAQRPRSIFAQVRSLDPGHVMHVGASGEPVTHAYWTPRLRVREDLSERDWIEATRERVASTVERHMLSDVPVAAFLSGGVDSGAVAAAMARSGVGRFKAFTIGFPGSPIDEAAAARAVADHLGCEHVVVPLQPMAAADILPAVQAAFDEPCAANSAVPLWQLAREASQHVKVVLCGEGGDELLIGYKRQHNAQRMGALRPLFEAIGPALRLVDRLPELPSRKWNYLRQNARRFRDAAMLSSGFQRFFASTQITSPALRARLYRPDFWLRHDGPDAFARLEAEYFGRPEQRRLDPLDQFVLGDLTVHMPGSLLTRLDRTSMAHSLEARVPFLSHYFVDWALTMPRAMKLRRGVGKYALRRAVEPWLPPGALDRPKQGFQLPFADWFAGDLNRFARETWNGSGAAHLGYLDPAAVDRLFVEHGQGQANHGRILYALTMFACWWSSQQGRSALAA